MSAYLDAASGPARSLTIGLALSNCVWEASLVAGLTSRKGAARRLGWKIEARRCLGLDELLADVGRGAVNAVVIDANFSQLTAAAIAQLQAHPVGVIAVCSDEDSERHARQLGFDHVVAVDNGDSRRTVERIVAVITPGPQSLGRRTDQPVTHPMALPPDGRAAEPPVRDHQSALAAPHLTGDAALPAPGRVIAFWGPAGAPGRTSLALAVAHTAARHGIETITIDGDSRAPGVAAALGVLDTDAGLATVANLADRGALSVHSLARHARQLDRNWRVLTGIRAPDDWRQLPASAVTQVLRCARALCELVVVDAGPELERDEQLIHDRLVPRRDAAAIVACESAEVVVAVCGPEPAALARLCSRLPAVRELAPAARFVVAVNRARSGLGPVASESEIRRVLGDAIDAHVEFVPDDQSTFDAATRRQLLPTEHAPRSPFALAIGRLTDVLTIDSWSGQLVQR